jgi:hypothetical protein
MAISLRDLRKHVLALTTLVDDGFAQSDDVAKLNFEEIKEHARGILALVEPKATTTTTTKDAPAMAERSPHAATATSAPKAADNEATKDAQKRADYARAAADKKPAFDPSTLYIRGSDQ